MTNNFTSLWEATAGPVPETQKPDGDYTTDILVIGAGFTGMSCALQLAKGGASVIVVDTVRPGYGASGRNGGQVIPGLKHDPDALDRMFGEATTEFAGKTADTVFSLIDEHQIDCDATKTGWIQAAVKKDHLGWLEQRMSEWQRRGAPVEMLDQKAIRDLTGTERLVGGWVDHRAGQLHPLKYIRGLTQAAQKAGVQVLAPAAVDGLSRANAKWCATIKDHKATVTCDHVVVASNAYSTDLFPKFKRSLIPVHSFQVATEPLSSDQLATVLPKLHAVSETRRIGVYYRIGPGGRLMLGGRGTFSEPDSEAAFDSMVAELHAFYPWTKSIPLEFKWFGRLAMNWEHLPHVHRPVENLTMAAGYNGRGVAMATSLGKAIADNLLSSDVPLPMRLSDIKPLPFHGMHQAYASIAIWYYQVRDYLER
ncbi:FAD-binding oxidoreductase [Thalassospira sp. MA62]|nr:FAD-binding oxidoreductase [Thalassospira sp. MA62]